MQRGSRSISRPGADLRQGQSHAQGRGLLSCAHVMPVEELSNRRVTQICHGRHSRPRLHGFSSNITPEGASGFQLVDLRWWCSPAELRRSARRFAVVACEHAPQNADEPVRLARELYVIARKLDRSGSELAGKRG
jgi:hypothetical protein